MVNKSLAKGDDLNAATWANFVERLRHDCVGDEVNHHWTADAIFIVQAKRRIYGLGLDYSDSIAFYSEDKPDTIYDSSRKFYESLSEKKKKQLNYEAKEFYGCTFLKLDCNSQYSLLKNIGGDLRAVGYIEKWEYVNSHFTNAAAKAFIARKKHDYPLGLRVYVDAQTHCWEFNAIKKAILDGTISFEECDR